MGLESRWPLHPLFGSDLSDEADAQQQFAAAKYYRLAEKNGNKIIGNSW